MSHPWSSLRSDKTDHFLPDFELQCHTTWLALLQNECCGPTAPWTVDLQAAAEQAGAGLELAHSAAWTSTTAQRSLHFLRRKERRKMSMHWPVGSLSTTDSSHHWGGSVHIICQGKLQSSSNQSSTVFLLWSEKLRQAGGYWYIPVLGWWGTGEKSERAQNFPGSQIRWPLETQKSRWLFWLVVKRFKDIWDMADSTKRTDPPVTAHLLWFRCPRGLCYLQVR